MPCRIISAKTTNTVAGSVSRTAATLSTDPQIAPIPLRSANSHVYPARSFRVRSTRLPVRPEHWATVQHLESSVQANLVRCILRLVPKIAQSVYDHRRLPKGTLVKSRLEVLSDPLIDGGCDDQKLLEHLREPLHVRGCYVVDAILKKA